MSKPKITADQELVATFPACCIPTLAAWQGAPGFEGPDMQNFQGATVEVDPLDDGMVRLTATDGRNLLCLRVAGHCTGGPAAFLLPDDFVESCRAPRPRQMFIEGSRPVVDWPAWMRPKAVLLTGARYLEHYTLTSLSGLIMPEDSPPGGDTEEWSLWAGEVGWNEMTWRAGEGWTGIVTGFYNEPAVDSDVMQPIPPLAIIRLASALEDPRLGMADSLEPIQRANSVLWHLGKSWAVTMGERPWSVRGVPGGGGRCVRRPSQIAGLTMEFPQDFMPHPEGGGGA